MANPGIYENTTWRIAVNFIDVATGDNTPVDDVEFIGFLWRNPDDDTPVFTWRESPEANEGSITHGPNSNQIALVARAVDHEGINPGRYTWKVYRLEDNGDYDYATGGRAYVGEAGELTSQFETVPATLGNATLGALAIPGPNGADGATIHTGSGAPSSDLGNDGDLYLRTSNSDLYKKIDGAWSVLVHLQGAAGINGNYIYVGAGTPDISLGANGDLFFSNTTRSLYAKSSNVWSEGVSLVGAQGPTGAAGANGATIYTGASAPSAGLGSNNDLYLRTSNSDLYRKSGGAWSVLVNLKGEQGDQGPPGENFTVDQVGLLADRGDFDAEAEGFSYLADDTGDLYIRKTATPGVWSDPIPFRGEKGDDGDDGPAGPVAPMYSTAVVDTLKTTDLDIGVRVRTDGYTTAGDHGDSVYEIVAGATGTNDGFSYINLNNGNQAKLILADPTTVRIRQTGAKADGTTDDTATIALVEAHATVQWIDLTGLTVDTTTTDDTNFTKNYYNGVVYKRSSTQTAPQLVRARHPVRPHELTKPWTKSPIINLADTDWLWLGTSISAQGLRVDSYGELTAAMLGARCRNLSWAASKNCFEFENDPFLINTVKCLSMTEDDRLRGVALYGNDSAYGTEFTGDGYLVNKAVLMTVDHRIKNQFIGVQAEGNNIKMVVLDHGRNDRGRARGTLTPDSRTITGVTKGVGTVIALSSSGLFAVGDAVGIRVAGIPNLDYHCAMVTAVDGGTGAITISLDTSGYSGAFTSGTVYKLDRTTICGAWQFTTWYTLWCSNNYGDGNVKIITCSSPSEYTEGPLDYGIASVNEFIYEFAAYHGFAFFDLTAAMEIDGVHNSVYLEDNVHPTEPWQRQAIANYWAAWLQGGTPRTVAPNAYLVAGLDTDYIDQRVAIWDRFNGGFGTPTQSAAPIGSETDVLGPETFTDGTLNTWTTVSGTIAPTVVAAPWNGALNAAKFSISASNLRSGIQKNVSVGEGRVLEVDVYFPVVIGAVPDTDVDINIMELRGASGGFYFIGINIAADRIALYARNLDAPGGDLKHLAPSPTTVFAAETVYTITAEMVKGGLIIYVDGELVGGPYEIDDDGQDPIAQCRFGLLSTGTGGDFDLYMRNMRVGDLAVYDISNPYSGDLSGRMTFVNGMAMADDDAPNFDELAETITISSSQVSGLGSLATLSAIGTSQLSNAAVTFAKFQNIADQRILGNDAGASGQVQQLSAGTIRSMLNLSTADSPQFAGCTIAAMTGTSIVLAGSIAQKATGTLWTNPSDERHKIIEGDYESGLAEIVQIDPKRYRGKPGNSLGIPEDVQSIGPTAQNAQASFPECVSTDDEGRLLLNPSPMFWALVNSIKELKAQNDALKARLEALEANGSA